MKARLQRAFSRYMPSSFAAAAARYAFPVTHAFLYGRLPEPAAPRPNVLHLTLNKAASQNTAKILAKVFGERGYRTVWPNRYAFYGTAPYFEDLSTEAVAANPNVTAAKSLFIASIGKPVTNEPILSATEQIVAIRDPRDILTSDYYSILHFHPDPTSADKIGPWRENKERAARLGIDGYALHHLPEMRTMFEDYVAISRRTSCLATLRFEDFISDFPTWLAALERALELDPSPARAAAVAPFAPKQPTTEKVASKIRSGRSGQFRDRLKRDTVAELDRELAHVLEHFGYA